MLFNCEALSISPSYAKAINAIKRLEPKIYQVPREEQATRPEIQKPKPPFQLDLERISQELDDQGFFNSSSAVEAQKRITVSIVQRQGQSQFRQSLLTAYNFRCAITDCDAGPALEAAHIIPYSESANNHPSNGLLLRADLHTLFDLNLIAINPEKMTIHLAPELKATQYSSLEGKELKLPGNTADYPDREALRRRIQECNWYKS